MKSRNAIPPTMKGLLPVSGGHNISYEAFGPEDGTVFLSFHGGPGGRSKERDLTFFSQEHRVILFDQRGCGTSTYENILAENTTPHLVNDTLDLLDHLNVKRVSLFACSWGTTLALCFAIAHPERVSSMVLNGVFLGTNEEIHALYDGSLARFFPETWEYVRAVAPENVLERAHAHIGKTDKGLAYEKALFAIERSAKSLSTRWEDVLEELDTYAPSPQAALVPHYFVNGCFLDDEHIIRNAKTLASIPTTIVSGRYDALCPPRYAHRLARAIGAELELTVGAHTRREPETERKLKQAIERHLSPRKIRP